MAEQKERMFLEFTDKGTVKKHATHLKGADRSTKSLMKSAVALSAAYIGVRGVVSVIRSSIEAFGIQEAAEKKLETALGRTSQALLDQAAALQQVSTFGDETIIGVQAMIGAFIDNEEQIALATAATLDLAAGLGIDLKNAGDLVAKTLGSSTNALTRYGIQVEGAVGSTERLESFTTNLANVFGGQAAAATETMSGAMAQASNAVGDLAEVFGEILQPVVTFIAVGIKQIAESLAFLIDKSDEAKESVIDQNAAMILQQELLLITAELNKQTAEALGLSTEKYDSQIESATFLIQIYGEQNEALILLAAETELFTGKIEGMTSRIDTLNMKIPALTTNFKPLQTEMKNAINVAKLFQEGFAAALVPNAGAGEGLKQVILSALTAMEGLIIASEAANIALTAIFVPGVGLVAILGALIAVEIAKAGVRSIKFGKGGSFTVPGPGGTDTVPVSFMATPGEDVTIRTPAQQHQAPAQRRDGDKIINLTLNVQALSFDNTVMDEIEPRLIAMIERGQSQLTMA